MNVILLRNIALAYGLEEETNELSLNVMLLELIHILRNRFEVIYVISSHQNILRSSFLALLQCVVEVKLALPVHYRETEAAYSLYVIFRDQYIPGIGVLKGYTV